MYGARYQATIFPMADLFGAAAVASVVAVGAWFGPRWGLSLGDLVAFIFLVSLFVQPLSELSETFDLTQTAIAGWRKVLGLLDVPVEMAEPSPGGRLPEDPLTVRTEGLQYAYPDGGGGPVLRGVDLREVAPESRRAAIRMVPQDGFLFDTTVRENVRYGKEGATDQDVEASFESLGLSEWVQSLPQGLDTHVGERGENLSVGERQLLALARAQMGIPGLLILDEATSAVDPETERALADALTRLSEGRTTVTIAHRLSTAEAAEEVLVFREGRIVERGTHAELASAGGVYASLYESWLGNIRAEAEA